MQDTATSNKKSQKGRTGAMLSARDIISVPYMEAAQQFPESSVHRRPTFQFKILTASSVILPTQHHPEFHDIANRGA
jgi:hypothetical protein